MIDTECVLPINDTGGIISIMINNPKKPVWAVIAQKRMRDLKITQDDLVAIFQVKTRGAVGHYFTGRREPSIKQLTRLAEYIGLSLSEISGGQEYVTPGPLPAGTAMSMVPLISWISAGDWVEAHDPYPLGDAAECRPV